jgi:hypothetical protein
MLYFVYDLPSWLFCALTMLVCMLIGAGGMLLTAPIVRRVLAKGDHNDIVSYFLSACGVFYGITLGLIAVGAWQSFSDVDTKVSAEAAALAALHRDVSSYPEPIGSQLRDQLKGYTEYVIHEAWPQQRRGEVPVGGTTRINDFQRLLYGFDPATRTQEILHAEAISQFNEFVSARRLRLQAVSTSLPAALWWVVGIGAILSISITWFFHVSNRTLHLLMVLLASSLIGLLIFLTAAMDNPFRGEVSIGPDAFVVVYEQLMKAK